jgi:RNA polymerase sigma-70 factor, ECF subfamily
MRNGTGDAAIRAACEEDPVAAVTLLLERHGAELLGFLAATLPSRNHAREVYTMAAEDLWRGLPQFEWRCSLRAWTYTVARNARARYLLHEARRIARDEVIADLPWLKGIADRTRSPTPAHLRTEIKTRLRELREQLSEDEQTLLMLRVDRGLSWNELAVVLGESADDTPKEVARAATRLRQRFQVLKSKLRNLAMKEGLFGGRER